MWQGEFSESMSSQSAVCSAQRQTWSESMQAIQQAHRALAVQYPELQLRLEFAEKRGERGERARPPIASAGSAEVGFFPMRRTA